MKHLLKLLDLSSDEIISILDLADELKEKQKKGIPHKVLEGKTLKEMSEECNLTVRQVWYSYNKVRQWLKKNITL